MDRKGRHEHNHSSQTLLLFIADSMTCDAHSMPMRQMPNGMEFA